MQTNTRTAGSLLLAVLLVSCLLLPACGGKKSGSSSPASGGKNDVQLTFWNTMSRIESQGISEILETFSSQNPTTSINMEWVHFYQARDKFEQAMKAGVLPDVFRADRFWISQFVEAGYLEELPLDEIRDEIDDLLPIARQIVFVQDKCYGVPQTLDCLGIFYNRAHFRDAGVTPPDDFDAFKIAAQKNTDSGKGRYGFFMHPEGWWFEPILFGFGGRYFEDGKLVLHSEHTLKASHFLLEMKEGSKVMPPVNLRGNTYDLMMQSFKNGQVSMIFNGPWAIRDLLEGSAFKDKTDNLGVAMMPKGPAGRFSPVGCQSYVIPKGTKHKAEALKLIKYLCSADIEGAMAKNNYGIPARKSLFSDPELNKDPFLSPFLRQIQEKQTLDSSMRVQKLYNAVGVFLRKVLNGDLSPEDALKDLETSWDKR
jgi:arabinogalactan oligomer/maltooligosaccharide transport system substrate-binding protein